MTDLNFSIANAQELLNSDDSFPVDFEIAWQWLGYSRKDAAKDKLLNNFDLDVDFSLRRLPETNVDNTFSHYREDIRLTVDCFKQLAMMAKTSKGKEVRKYFLDCEKRLKQINQERNKTLEQYQNELEAVKLSKTIPEDLKKLETLSIALADVVKQNLLGGIPKMLNQSFINSEQMQRDLNTSLVANRLGLAFNKQLKTLELIQDTYSPDAYNKLKDMYHTLAVDYNQMVERQSTSGISPETVQDFKDRLKAGEEWFRKAEIWQKEIESLAKELETDNLCLKMEIQRQCRLSKALMKDNQDVRQANARLVATVNRLEQENKDLETAVNRYKNTRGGLKPFKPLK